MTDHYETLKSITDFDERVEYLSTFDIGAEAQPTCFLQVFDDIKDRNDPFADALRIAEIIKNKYEPIVIERESSYCMNKYITIMDELENEDSIQACYPVSGWLFKRAFRSLGFKRASECDEKDLEKLYRECPFFEP